MAEVGACDAMVNIKKIGGECSACRCGSVECVPCLRRCCPGQQSNRPGRHLHATPPQRKTLTRSHGRDVRWEFMGEILLSIYLQKHADLCSIYKEIGPGERIAFAKLAIDTFEETGRPFRIAIDVSIWLFQIQASKGENFSMRFRHIANPTIRRHKPCFANLLLSPPTNDPALHTSGFRVRRTQ